MKRIIVFLIIFKLLFVGYAEAYLVQLALGAARVVGAEIAIKEAEKIIEEAWNKYNAGATPQNPLPKKVGHKVKTDRQAAWLTSKYGWVVNVGSIVFASVFGEQLYNYLTQKIKTVYPVADSGAFVDPSSTVSVSPQSRVASLGSSGSDGQVVGSFSAYVSVQDPISGIVSLYGAISSELSAGNMLVDRLSVDGIEVQPLDGSWNISVTTIDGQVIGQYFRLMKTSFRAYSQLQAGASFAVEINIDAYYDTENGVQYSAYVSKVIGKKIAYYVPSEDKTYAVDYTVSYLETHFIVTYWHYSYTDSNGTHYEGYLGGGGTYYWGIPLDQVGSLGHNVFLGYINPNVRKFEDSLVDIITLPDGTAEVRLGYSSNPNEYWGIDAVSLQEIESSDVLGQQETKTFADNISQSDADYDVVLDMPDSAINSEDPYYAIEDGSKPYEPLKIQITYDELFKDVSYPYITDVSYSTDIVELEKSGSIYEYLKNFIMNNPYSSAISGISITASSAVCKIDGQLYGKDISIDFCSLDNIYVYIRPIVVALFVLLAIMVMFA